MADNVPITAGTGTTIATDDIAGVHYQRTKLVDGTLDSTVAIPGNSSGLWVSGDLATLGPFTPTIDIAVYAANDRVGSVITITNAGARNGGQFQIVGGHLEDNANSNFSLELWLFGASPTLVGADNAAFDITDANRATAVYKGVLDFMSAQTKTIASSSRITPASMLGGPVSLFGKCEAGTTSIFGIFKALGAYDAVATSDLVLTLQVIRY